MSSTTTADSPNVGVAFGLVIGAGAATAIGASVVFFPFLVKLASRRVLAGALGLSAGVMTYVSFVEIFQKSILSFLDAQHSQEMAYVYATLCFFGGVVTMMIIDLLVKCLSGGQHHHHHDDEQEEKEDESQVDFVTTPHCACVAEDPLHELDEWKKRANDELQGQHEELTSTSTTENVVVKNVDSGMPFVAKHVVDNVVEMDSEEYKPSDGSKNNSDERPSKADVEEGNSDDDDDNVKKPTVNDSEEEDTIAKKSGDTDDNEERQRAAQENRRLIHMGINTAVAIGLHNFPEGLATFVAALDDPRVGAVLAVAIGIHNIPEGLCVALPIYYATGNRCKAFLWACVSGVSEPIAALLGWAVLANNFSNNLYAILFGLVAGMMVVISTKELLPTAHRYDPDDTVVTHSYIGGMCIMALSLVLFVL